MTLKSFTDIMLPAIETKLKQIIARLDEPSTRPFFKMMTYHMGWSGGHAGPEATGKRIRPLLVLLTCAACGKDWQPALPAAACLELIHNFSLAHDDIQDGSELRRGQLAVWKKWGTAQAINVGDALLILAHMAFKENRNEYTPDTVLHVGEIIDNACLALSCGQFLDIAYEKRTNLSIEDYWQMVSGKTATLLSACTQIGAILGEADKVNQENYRSFGNYLGLAFQAQDDYLGIWGNSALMGKSTESDLAEGKKTLPVLFGLSKNGLFARRWVKGAILAEEVAQMSEQLAIEGGKLFTQEASHQMTNLALKSLRAAEPQGEAGEALCELTKRLLIRKN
jgi:geranylgeranyl diphosphate synthase type I